jgi:hypothetical protein
MVNQYPHTISVTWKGKSTQDANLNWVEGADFSFESECRAEVNSSGKKIAGSDGALVEYSFTVYLPKTETIIPIGANYALNGTTVGTVKGAWNGQLNSRIWV